VSINGVDHALDTFDRTFAAMVEASQAPRPLVLQFCDDADGQVGACV
jgi:hypothetical protein